MTDIPMRLPSQLGSARDAFAECAGTCREKATATWGRK